MRTRNPYLRDLYKKYSGSSEYPGSSEADAPSDHCRSHHAGGKWWLVDSMAKASIAAGADGLMVEVHNNPECALCDGAQSLKPDKFNELINDVTQIAKVLGKTL
mgnify:CR=1 FL=1